MNFDTFFSERDRMNAIDAAKAMVFLPENCYFVEEPKPEINFYFPKFQLTIFGLKHYEECIGFEHCRNFLTHSWCSSFY